LINRCVEICL